MSYGIPVVTLKDGDVYYTVGEEFSVENYESMYLKVEEYYTNKKYYEEMRLKALLRVDVLSDISATLQKVNDKILELEGK